MSFSEALDFLKEGRRIAREGWNGKGMYVYLVTPQEDGYRPYLMMKTVNDERVPWIASQSDLLVEDWNLVEE